MAQHSSPAKGNAPQADPLDFLSGGGLMERRIRARDWANTPLGPPEQWPQSLKTALKIALNSRYPIWMGWGADLINFYNDPYIPVLGKRDEWALGASARDVWKEIWQEHLGPQADAVMQRGEASWNDQRQLIMYRNGYAEETYFTFSFSPLPADSGGVGGLFCTCTEDTERVVGERRLAVLSGLATATADARSEQEAADAILRTLAQHDDCVAFALLYVVSDDARCACLVGGNGGASVSNEPAIALGGSHPGRSVWPLDRSAREGLLVLRDLDMKLPGGRWPEPAQTAVVVPLAKAGHGTARGFLVAGASPRLPFDQRYESFFELLARGAADALSNARAFEDEKRRAEALAELDRTKTLFFSNVSHEFRTPLTLMLGPVEDLLERSFTELAPATKGQLEIVHRNALRLLKLVNTLLDFSRIEAGRMRASYEETELASYTAELASSFRAACERAGLSLAIDCSLLPADAAPAYVDRDMWEKIVLNLISNAFKFTLEGGIEVGLKRVGDTAELCVRDTGVGIPAEELPRIFERFHRVRDQRGRTHEGTGIGLALVRELVRMHGGRIDAESRLNQGSAFTVSLPLGMGHLDPAHIQQAKELVSTKTEAQAFVEEALRWLPGVEHGSQVDFGLEALRTSAHLGRERSVSGRSKARILWADDNADMRDYVARLLGEHFEVETAPDGQAALDKARSMLASGAPPDLVLSDVMMPQLDGFGLLRELRADPALASIPIILLSARAGEEARIEGVEAGADDYLIKPFSSRELVARVQAQVKMAAFRRESNRALRESATQLAEAQRLAHVGSWQWDAATDRNTVSDELREIFGVPAGSPFPDFKDQNGLLYPHESFVRLDAAVQEAVRTGEGFSLDIPALRNGEPIWVTSRSKAMRDAGGKVIGLRGTVQDITDRKRREASQALLVQIADDLSRLVDAYEIMQVVGSRLGGHLDLDLCVFADVDDAGDSVTVKQGWSKEGVASLKQQAFRIADYLTEEFRRANRAGEKIIVRNTTTDERTDAQGYARLSVGAFVTVPFLRSGRWTAYFAATDTEPRDWRADEIDLIEEACDRAFPRIERARAEAELRASEARLRLATQAAKIGAFDWDIQTGLNRWTPELEKMYGLTPGEFGSTQAAWEQLIHPDDREGAIAKVEETFATGQPVEHEWRAVWRDGSTHWISARYQGFKDAAGNRVRLTGVNIDISGKKQAEATRARLAAIVASSSEAIVSKTLEGTITSWNEAAERIFGYAEKEMVGASIRRIVPGDRQAEEDDILARISHGQRIENYETVRLRKDGRLVDVSVTISPIFDAAGKVIGASKIAHDITEKKRTEERERLLMREVNHRAKNMLALIQAIARQTAVASPDDFIERFTQRVQALSASQDVLVNSGWRSVPIEALVRAQLGHFADLIGQRILLSGPEVKITAAAAQAIGLALHELATNAAKYGALSNDSGTVNVTWDVADGHKSRFELAWAEKGGPTVMAPRRAASAPP